MIRYATIGTNIIADRFLDAARQNDLLHYAAVYSRNTDTAAGFAAKYHVERICTNLEELAAADDIDGIYIASPNSLHYEQAALLLAHKITDNRLPSQIQGEQGTMLIKSINNPHEIIFVDRNGEEDVLFSADNTPDMSGEISQWVNLIKEGSGTNIHSQYSLMALSLMDQARAQMGIQFPADIR